MVREMGRGKAIVKPKARVKEIRRQKEKVRQTH